MAIEPEEYEVYAALIDATCVHPNANIRLIVLLDHTDLSPAYRGRATLDYVKQQAPAVLLDTLDDFEAKNEDSYSLEHVFDLTVEYRMIGDVEKSAAFGGQTQGWTDFYAKYPRSQGITWLSRVGFNSDRNQALVYMGNQRHTLMGSGEYMLLARDQGHWQPSGLVRAWIS